jgi:hypothetical protein
MRKLVAPAAALAIAIPAVALAGASGPKVSGKGAGQVKIGKLHSKLKAAGAVGKQVPGCELAGPGEKGTRLRSPLVGSANLTRKDPRRIRSILITGGKAQAKGVGIGDPAADIESAFANVKVDHTTEEVFQLTLYKIPKASGGRFQFGVSTKTHKIEVIGIPYIAFCE